MKLLFVLPRAIGDATCASAAFVSLKTYMPDIVIDLCCNENIVDIFGDLKEIRHAFHYIERSEEIYHGGYDWIIDCASEPFSLNLIKQVPFKNYVGHDPADPSVHVINGIAIDPSRTVAYQSFFDYPEQPAWHLEASLVSSMLNKPLSEWANKPFEPFFNFRTDHDVFLDKDDLQIDILFIPCGSNELKRWPETHWSDLLKLFSRENYKIGIIVGYEEKSLFPKLSTMTNIKVYSEISTRKIAALCENASLVIANDCGPMHIAAASGANLIAIFGPTNPRCWFAYSGAHRKYVQKGTGANKLGILTEITTWDDWPAPDDIWITAKNMLGDNDYDQSASAGTKMLSVVAEDCHIDRLELKRKGI